MVSEDLSRHQWQPNRWRTTCKDQSVVARPVHWICLPFQAETERKSYDMCLDHADELEDLVARWRDLHIITPTQLSEMDRVISKAPSSDLLVAQPIRNTLSFLVSCCYSSAHFISSAFSAFFRMRYRTSLCKCFGINISSTSTAKRCCLDMS